MTLEERDGVTVITGLPVEQMAFLALGLPLDGEVAAVLRSLLAGARVELRVEALEYKRYKKTAPLGAYQKFMGMERQLREMGIVMLRAHAP